MIQPRRPAGSGRNGKGSQGRPAGSRFGSAKKAGRPLSPKRGEARKKSRPVSQVRRSAGSVFDSIPVQPFGAKKKAASAPVKKVQNKNQQSPETKLPADRENHAHRLQQVLAAAGYGSRRACEDLIRDGRVTVDGETAVLGQKVYPAAQKIQVDAESLPKMKPVYLAVNKPKGFLCTNRDQQGRRRVIDLIPPKFGRLFPIGRLDQESEGLIILTNDGALCERLAHPRYEVAKRYHVQVAGLVELELVEKLKKGIHIAEGVVQADEVSIKSKHKLSSLLEITLREGKNREIRRMLARIGHKVMHLKRVAVGPVKLGKLLSGDCRELTKEEVARLYAAAKGHHSDSRNSEGRSSDSRKSDKRTETRSAGSRAADNGNR